MKATGKRGVASTFGALVISAICFASFSASAETDMRRIKCGEFTSVMQSKDREQEIAGALFMGFLWGLYKSDDEPPVIGTPSDNERLAQLAKYCVANPNAGLMTAVDKLWDKD